jgi:hypothetical protein
MCKVTKNIILLDKKTLHNDKKVPKIWEMLTKEVTLQRKIMKKLFIKFLFTNH